MKIKHSLVLLAVSALLFNQLAFLIPTKTKAELPPQDAITIHLLAAGARSAVLTETSDSATTNNNGSEWYYWPGHSMGFAPGGDTIDQSLGADTTTDNDSESRLSWHMWPDRIVAGYRAGDNILNWSADWSRFVYQSDNVPAYYPSGPQINVPSTSLEGWSLCYVGSYTEQVLTSDLWGGACTGNYLLLAGANYAYSPNKIDVLNLGTSVLDAPGGTQLQNSPVYPGFRLNFNLYGSDGVTAIPWNDYKVFISDCVSDACEALLSNPLYVSSEWDNGHHTDNTDYIIPTSANNHYLAIVPADSATYVGEPGSVVYLYVSAPSERSVSSCADLQAINSNLHDNYTLTTDLDCAETASWNDGAGFIPIGNNSAPFTGEFDGQGHSISNLHVNSGADYAGLFGVMSESSFVYSLSLVNVNIQGRNRVGGLVGMQEGDVFGCSVSGSVAGNSYVGGLTGYHNGNDNDVFFLGAQTNELHTLTNQGMKILDNLKDLKTGKLKPQLDFPANTILISYSSATVSGSNSVGGLVGFNRGLIELGTATGNVTLQNPEHPIITGNGVVTGSLYNVENSRGGGLVGTNSGLILAGSATGNVTGSGGINYGGFSGYNSGLVIMSFATGNTSGGSQMGGFTGWNEGEVGMAYARGSITGTHDLGGFAGISHGQIIQVYSTGAVSGTGSNIGGLIGYFTDNSEDLISSFWDNQTSGQSVGCGNIDCSGLAFGKTSAAMKLQSTYTTELGADPWDFENTFIGGWNINPLSNDGYPFLRIFDQDSDGILDSVENSGPNHGDANNDSIGDSLQANVTSFTNNQNNLPEVLQVPEACSITSVNTQAESGLSLQDAGFNYPAGLTNFTINCGEDNPGYTADIALYFYDLDPTGLVLRKYNATNSSYTAITPLSLTQVTIAGRQVVKVVYQVTDGGLLDQDGTANGIIVDPVGLATNVVRVPNTGLGGGL